VSGAPGDTAAKAPGGGVPLKARLQRGARAAVAPLVGLLIRLEVRPDQVTAAGLGFSLLSGLIFFAGHPAAGALALLLAGLCDVLDGELARATGVVSRFGAFLDSTLDRLSEAVVLLGVAAYYVTNLLGSRETVVALVDQLAGFELDPVTAVTLAHNPRVWPVTYVVVAMVSVLALIGSFMVSYTRARAEGLGLDCKVGWFERPERMALLIAGGLATGATRVWFPMPLALLLLAALSLVTAGQRMVHVYRITRGTGMDQPGGPSDG
jgi:CDP-diacylglycerol---glycerol-3-phosphate 3-phosphatidyltransferase